MREPLASIRFKDGILVEFSRDDKGIVIQSADLEVSLPGTTAQEALALFSLFESVGEAIEFPKDAET